MNKNQIQNIYGFLAIFVLLFVSSCKPDPVKPSPVAEFSYSGNTQAPATIIFTNSSTNASTYEWNFGDGGSSTEKNPSHIYTSGGSFTVSLKAKGEGGENSITKTIVISSVATPVANFTILIGNNEYAPSTVYFLNTSNNASSYDWDFGDGSLHSSQSSPNHAYTSAGIYTVTLKAMNSVGVQNIITKTVNILAAPTQVRITKLTLVSMPFLDNNGAGWDPLDGPDVFFNILNQGGSVLLSGEGGQVNNLLQSQLPIQWTFNTPYVVSNLSDPRYFQFYDFDTADPNDPINYVGIKFSDWVTYPTTLTATQNGIEIKLTLEWF